MEITKNVIKHLNKTSNVVGNLKGEEFSDEILDELKVKGIESPIEQLLYISMIGIMSILAVYRAEPIFSNDEDYLSGVEIYPQYNIGKYRVDFLVVKYFIKDGQKKEN